MKGMKHPHHHPTVPSTHKKATAPQVLEFMLQIRMHSSLEARQILDKVAVLITTQAWMAALRGLPGVDRLALIYTAS